MPTTDNNKSTDVLDDIGTIQEAIDSTLEDIRHLDELEASGEQVFSPRDYRELNSAFNEFSTGYETDNHAKLVNGYKRLMGLLDQKKFDMVSLKSAKSQIRAKLGSLVTSKKAAESKAAGTVTSDIHHEYVGVLQEEFLKAAIGAAIEATVKLGYPVEFEKLDAGALKARRVFYAALHRAFDEAVSRTEARRGELPRRLVGRRIDDAKRAKEAFESLGVTDGGSKPPIAPETQARITQTFRILSTVPRGCDCKMPSAHRGWHSDPRIRQAQADAINSISAKFGGGHVTVPVMLPEGCPNQEEWDRWGEENLPLTLRIASNDSE